MSFLGLAAYLAVGLYAVNEPSGKVWENILAFAAPPSFRAATNRSARPSNMAASNTPSITSGRSSMRRSSVTANRDVRAELARALVEAGHPPYHLRRRGDELDEIYRRYFAANEPAGVVA